jgi:hypothetical protein
MIFFPAIVFLGRQTIQSDWSVRKIENRLVLGGLFYAIGVYLLFVGIGQAILAGLLSADIFAPSVEAIFWYFDRWCINLCVSGIVAYVLWRQGMWGAGDAKLFICYAALVPMGQYTRGLFYFYFPAALILIYTFLPALGYVACRAAISFFRQGFLSRYHQMRLEFSVSLKSPRWWQDALKGLMALAVFFTTLFLLGQFLGMQAWLGSYQAGVFVVLMLLLFGKILTFLKQHFYVVVLMAAGYFLYFGWGVLQGNWAEVQMLGQMLLRSFEMFAAFFLFKKLLDLYLQQAQEQKTVALAHWMFLGVLIAWFI